MHYYSHNINDFNNATIHLSVEEECMYHRALAWYYSNETPLPNDKAKIYRYLRATTKKLQTAVDNILDDFFTQESDGFHQSRCDAEIQEYKDRQTKAIEAGKASAEARRKSSMKQSDVKQSNNDSLTDVQQVDEHKSNDRSTTVQPTNNHKPITNNQEPITKNKYVNEVAEVFEFWKTTFGKMATTKLSDERKRKIIARLKDGYTVEQIKQAIVNCSQNEFNIAGGHTDIELICRDVKHLERYMELKPQTIQPQQPAGNSRFGTKDDPLAVDVVWNQPVVPVSQMTYEEWEAEEKAKQAARESVKTKGFEVIE